MKIINKLTFLNKQMYEEDDIQLESDFVSSMTEDET